MKYVHDIYTKAEAANMRHYRQDHLPSGLISMREIARSEALIMPSPRRTYSANLMVAIDPFASPYKEQPAPDKSVQCNTPAEMTEHGIKEWSEIIRSLGDSALRVELAPIPIYKLPEERITPNGLVLPLEQDEFPEFSGYVASPEELSALEAMVQRVNIGLRPPVENTGLYL